MLHSSWSVFFHLTASPLSLFPFSVRVLCMPEVFFSSFTSQWALPIADILSTNLHAIRTLKRKSPRPAFQWWIPRTHPHSYFPLPFSFVYRWYVLHATQEPLIKLFGLVIKLLRNMFPPFPPMATTGRNELENWMHVKLISPLLYPIPFLVPFAHTSFQCWLNYPVFLRTGFPRRVILLSEVHKIFPNLVWPLLPTPLQVTGVHQNLSHPSLNPFPWHLKSFDTQFHFSPYLLPLCLLWIIKVLNSIATPSFLGFSGRRGGLGFLDSVSLLLVLFFSTPHTPTSPYFTPSHAWFLISLYHSPLFRLTTHEPSFSMNFSTPFLTLPGIFFNLHVANPFSGFFPCRF